MEIVKVGCIGFMYPKRKEGIVRAWRVPGGMKNKLIKNNPIVPKKK